MKKIFRSRTNRKIAGVFGGFSQFLKVDATILRLIMVILMFRYWHLSLLYLVAALVIPSEPKTTTDPFETFFNRYTHSRHDSTEQKRERKDVTPK